MQANVKMLEIYERILAIIWQRFAPTFGQRTIAAIARNTIAADSEKYPVLQDLYVDDNGFRWTALAKAVGDDEQSNIDQALEAFLDDFFEALSDLIGRLIVTRAVTQARREAGAGGEEK